MRKLYFICCLTFFCAGSSFCQLPNNSFETWNAGLPDGWFAALIPGYNILEQSTDAHSGSYCAKLNVVDISGNPYGSSLYTGDVNGLTTPISYVPGSVDFWYKLTTLGGDQLSAVVFVYGGGNMIGLGSIQLNSAAAYTQASLPVLNLTGATSADSINVTFIINNPAGATHIGTTAQVDDVTLTVSSGINPIKNSASAALEINPCIINDVLNLKYESNIQGSITVSIYSTNGKMTKSFNTEVTKGVNRIAFNLNDIASGSYICNLKSEHQNIAKSFIVNRH